MATTAGVIASARAETDQTGSDQGGTTAELTAWLQEDYPLLVRLVSHLMPKRYQLTVFPTIPSGANYVAVTGLDTYGEILYVAKQQNTSYVAVNPADTLNFLESNARLGWAAGPGTLNVWPEDDAPGTYMVVFLPNVTLPASDSEALKLPPGFEKILVQNLAARIRRRLEQSPTPHIEEAERLWKTLKTTLSPGHTTPHAPSDFNADDY